MKVSSDEGNSSSCSSDNKDNNLQSFRYNVVDQYDPDANLAGKKII